MRRNTGKKFFGMKWSKSGALDNTKILVFEDVGRDQHGRQDGKRGGNGT